jgi:hypothetical protein
MTTSFWLYNPNILLKSDEISKLWPSDDMTFNNKLNAISRLVILLTIIGYLTTKNIKILLSGTVTLGTIILLFFLKTKKVRKEGFISDDDRLSTINFTEPTVRNPLMNVALPELNENPKRGRAEPAFLPSVEEDINEKTKQFVVNNFNDPDIDQRLFNDLGDNFAFDRSMHAWYPMPNTTIPNDQKGFAEYCYADMIACRDEDNNELACVRNMPPRWQN